METVLSTRSDVDAQFVFTVGGAFGTGNADENTVGAIYRDEVDFANSVISIFLLLCRLSLRKSDSWLQPKSPTPHSVALADCRRPIVLARRD